MKKTLFYGIFLLLWLPTFSQQSNKNMIADHAKFRQTYPFHIQTIAHRQYNDGSCTLIFSEPAPHTNSLGFEDCLNQYPHKISIKKHTIGADGWVKDVVVSINKIDKNGLATLIKKLSAYNFHTDYKAYSLDLNQLQTPHYFTEENLNFNVNLSDIYSIFDNENERLGNYFVKNERVFLSEIQNAVLWIIDPTKELNKENLRRFALDADIVLGCIRYGKKVIIVGRQRASSVVDMPPLRTETLLMLASSDELSLRQSFQRSEKWSGKTADNSDWSPIYLTPKLKHTEFGSLLNIADQMLKSWSQDGLVEYNNFPHPRPDKQIQENNGLLRQVIEKLSTDLELIKKEKMNLVEKQQYERAAVVRMKEKQILEQLEEAQSKYKNSFFNKYNLHYEWTTARSVKYDYNGGIPLFAPNRLSALPIRYKSNSGQSELDDEMSKQGQAYFASLSSSMIIRVAQYTFLAQVFEKTGIKKTLDSNTNVSSKKNTQVIERFFSYIKHPNPKELDKNDVKNTYSAYYADEHSRWIKTPSIVSSVYKQDFVRVTGGHNLKLEIDNSAVTGNTNNGTINEADLSKVFSFSKPNLSVGFNKDHLNGIILAH